MKWIILIGDEKFNLEFIKEIDHYGCIYMRDSGIDRVVVDYEKEHIFYDYVEELVNDYDNEELSNIPFLNPKFIMMICTSDELMKKILLQDNYLKGIHVDDDNGLIIPI